MKKSLNEIKGTGLIITILLLMVGCDAFNESDEEISLKGENITKEYFNSLSEKFKSSDINNSVQVYSINTNSPKAKELEEKIIEHLESNANKTTKNLSGNLNTEQLAEPVMDDAIILEDESDYEVVITPIDNHNDLSNEFSYTNYDSETNSFESETFYYKAVSNMSESQMESNLDEAMVDVFVRDQQGLLVYNETFSKDFFSKTTSDKGIGQSQGCMGWCIEKELEYIEMFTFTRLYCMAFGAVCAAAILSECTITCIGYAI